MAIVGYARVSSSGQNLTSQLNKLQEYGCDKIFQEKISGIDQDRQELKNCLNYLREADTLIITKLDRLARSAVHLGQIIDYLQTEKIGFVVIDQQIDTTTPAGKLLFHMLSAFAEFEHGIRKERQADGIKSALNKGVRFGRPKKTNSKLEMDVISDKRNGMTLSKLKSKYSISQTTIYRILSKHKNIVNE
ncbi:DNA-invertase hin (plasmid) [Piscirickettsia salmonis]|uniref:recombinase family protein n=1 Tax=Piscirickettsia salmonis TaxID=1238 RepID=UPI0012BAFCB2|nr:recombinase family protein [Piscirickettsia salmonis]QGP56678.1 DNA-invertase hin [Piscirickettsia salmonis]QGP61706.1 DNA-invertase hin [Piscirickettsia salmonis]QGP66248.1 DNA-invertase hin [Piscirickettsia salmonis]